MKKQQKRWNCWTRKRKKPKNSSMKWYKRKTKINRNDNHTSTNSVPWKRSTCMTEIQAKWHQAKSKATSCLPQVLEPNPKSSIPSLSLSLDLKESSRQTRKNWDSLKSTRSTWCSLRRPSIKSRRKAAFQTSIKLRPPSSNQRNKTTLCTTTWTLWPRESTGCKRKTGNSKKK